jgi:hypothetical protein
VGAAEVVDHDSRAFLGEQQGVLATKSAARAGNDGYPPVECSHDDVFLS